LSQLQINGIIHLVSSSVPRLSTENVTVVDSSGKLLSEFKNKTGLGALNSDQLEYQAKVEHSLQNRIKTMLEKALGPEKAIVRVSCALDFKRQEKTEERFYPDNSVVRSEQSLREKSSEPKPIPQGIPGIRSNLPAENAAQNPENKITATQKTFEKQDRTVNFEIGKVTSHTFEPVGELKRISVAVLVDGTYETVQKSETEVEHKYIPRTSDEMQKLENICKSAVNFDAARGDKVEVVNIPFETTKAVDIDESARSPGWLTRLKDYQPYFKYAFFGLFLLLSFTFVVKPLVRWLADNTDNEMEIIKQLPKTVGEIENEFGGGSRQLTFTDQASQLVASDNETSVEVMRDWLKEK
jgi:flagellar M-ring protein FliF